MKKSLNTIALGGLLLVAGSISTIAAETAAPTTPTAPPSREKTVLVTVSASVEAINHTNREVTLKGPLGNEVTFIVDPHVKRLNEVKVGDFVRADYYISIAAELRAPTPEEEKDPIVVLEAGGKSPDGTTPAAGGLRRFKVVTTVEGVDLSTETITIKGPRGKFATIHVPKSPNLSKVTLGEKIIVTYTEALAISLEKTEAKGGKEAKGAKSK
jgi:hypothetical protein